MVVHLLLHGLGLAFDDLGQRTRALGGLGNHHRDRGLERVRQVADVGPLALDHLLVVLHQGVQFLRQRLQFGRIGLGQAMGLAAAHGRHFATQVEQRAQADPDLDHDGDHQQRGEQQKGRRGRDDEIPDVVIDGATVLRRQEDHRRLAADQEVLLRAHPQRLVLWPASVVGDRPSGPRVQPRLQIRRRPQHGVEQRVRTLVGDRLNLAAAHGLSDLPVAAGIGPERLLVGERRGEDIAVVLNLRIGGEVRDQVG